MSYMAIKLQAPQGLFLLLKLGGISLFAAPWKMNASHTGLFSFLPQMTFNCTWLLISGMGHLLQVKPWPSWLGRIQTPINISVLFPSLQVTHKFSDESMELCIYDFSKFIFHDRQHRKKSCLAIMIGLQWSAVSGSAQLNSSVHWRDNRLLSRAIAKFWACCKLQGSNNSYYLSKYCSRTGIKLTS